MRAFVVPKTWLSFVANAFFVQLLTFKSQHCINRFAFTSMRAVMFLCSEVDKQVMDGFRNNTHEVFYN